jgi:hypothetical protein
MPNDHRRSSPCKSHAEGAHVTTLHGSLTRGTRAGAWRGDQANGRGERIRTSGLYVPNVALYQAKLHPDDDRNAPCVGLRKSGRTARAHNSSRASRALESGSICRLWRAWFASACAPLGWRPARRCAARWTTISAALTSPCSMARRISLALGVGAPLHRHSKRQRRLAFAQVVADVLAQFLGVAFVVEQVVDELERRAQRPAVAGAGLFGAPRRRRPGPRPGARWPRTAWQSCSG